MPRAVMADQLGPLDNYSLRDYDPGAPGEGEIRIAIRAAGVSFVDVLNATGQYQHKAPVPFVPGSEFAGVVDALGPGVSGFSVGQPVLASRWGGAYADAAVVAASSAVAIPRGMDFETASVFKVSALTVWHALVDRAQLRSGETLLVMGAGGATGYAAVQLGKYLGARVIASATSEVKRDMARSAGADAVIDARSPHWREEVKAVAEDGLVDVVFDPVGGDSTEPAFRCLGLNGRHLVIGFPRGITALPTNLPLLKGASLVGVNLQQFSLNNPAQAIDNTRQVFQLAATGLLWPVIARTWPLAEFAEAMHEVSGGRQAGRIVLTMDA